MTIYRPGQHIYYPGSGVRVVQPGGAAAVPWYLSGGIAAANCLAAYTPKGAASLAASYDNNAAPGNGLADGTYDAAPGTAPTFNAATGWTFNGRTQYLLTGLTPASGYSMLFRLSNVGNEGRIGSYGEGSSRFYIRPSDGSGNLWYGNGGYLVVAPNLVSGVVGTAGQQGYRNGVADGSAIGAWDVVNPCALVIGACNANTVLSWFLAASIQALVVYNITITAVQVLAVSVAMAAL